MAHSHGSNGGNGITCFKNAHIIDGSGRPSFHGGLVVDGERIKMIGDIPPEPNGNGTQVVDLEGKTLMPGLILSHVHLSYNHVNDLPDLDLKHPAETPTTAPVSHPRPLLACGYPAGLSAGAPDMLHITART